MTKMIKVTGWLDPAILDEDEVDLDDPTGLSSEGFDRYHARLSRADLDNIDFTLEEEE